MIFRIVHINFISEALGEKHCLSLSGFHEFTGKTLSKLQSEYRLCTSAAYKIYIEI